jgi:DNA primase
MDKVATGTLPRIDFPGVKSKSSLARVLTDHLGRATGEGRKARWKCPWHPDRSPSLELWDGGKRWRCWPCGLQGDALDFITRYDRVDVVEAAKKLDPSIGAAKPHVFVGGAKPAPPRPPKPLEPEVECDKVTLNLEPWRDPEWQSAADRIVREAEARLWSPLGRDALAWLNDRGLGDHTIRRFRLGFIADHATSAPLACIAEDGRPRPIFARRGVTIPLVAPGAWYGEHEEPAGPRWVGIKVRRLRAKIWEPWDKADGPKNPMARGSKTGYAYPWPDLAPGADALICEGEIDALLAQQEIGHLVNVVTVGGALINPRPETLSALAGCPAWLIASDMDDAGDESSAAWRRRGGDRCRRLLLPTGKDIGDFVQAGGDLRAWLGGECKRLGL